MKRRNAWRRRAHRHLRREAKTGRVWPLNGYAEVYGALAHAAGTTRAADRRQWPYRSRWTQPELDQIRRDAEERFQAMRECWDDQAPWEPLP